MVPLSIMVAISNLIFVITYFTHHLRVLVDNLLPSFKPFHDVKTMYRLTIPFIILQYRVSSYKVGAFNTKHFGHQRDHEL